MKRRRKEKFEIGERKRQDEEETEENKKDQKTTNILMEKRKLTDIEEDGASASDQKSPTKIAREMQMSFGKAEEEEMDKEKLREAKRNFEAEFGGDDAEEYMARTRTVSEEVSLRSLEQRTTLFRCGDG